MIKALQKKNLSPKCVPLNSLVIHNKLFLVGQKDFTHCTEHTKDIRTYEYMNRYRSTLDAMTKSLGAAHISRDSLNETYDYWMFIDSLRFANARRTRKNLRYG